MVKIITNLGILMRLAKTLSSAKKLGNSEEIAKAQKEHDNYKDLCLKADEVSLNYKRGHI